METNSQHSNVTTIFATELSRSWSVIFTLLQQNKFTRLGIPRLERILRGVTYKYRLRENGAAKQFLVTVQSSPLIPDMDLALYFRWCVVVKKVIEQSYAFNHQIGRDLMRIVLLLNENVEGMATSHGIRRKLFFQGKFFYCGRCYSKHTFHEGCSFEREDEKQQPSAG